jgi:ubiquinone/menaquinone biosynthesis C-methylase UbiE
MMNHQPDPEVVALWQAYAESRFSFGQELSDMLAAEIGIPNWIGKRVLDVGCGDGRIAQAFAAAGANVTGMEINFLRIAQSAGEISAGPLAARCRFVVGDGTRLPFAAAGFDLVILCDVIEHVKDPQAVLAEIARVLRPDGHFYASVPNRLSVVNLASDPHYNVSFIGLLPRSLAAWYVIRARKLSTSYTVEKYFSWPAITKLFRRGGFKSVELKGRYARKICAGDVPKAPGRRWMGTLLRVPGMRTFMLHLAQGRLFRFFVQPSWEFLACK